MYLLLLIAVRAATLVATSEAVQRTAWDLMQQVALFAVALATLYGLVIRPTIKAMGRKFGDAVERIVEGQTQHTEVLERVEHQVYPNGGKSAHDYARKAYELGKHTTAELQAIRAEQRNHSQRLDLMQGELTAAGWRQQELSEKFTVRDVAGREALVLFREALAEQGIMLPIAPTEEVESKP